MLLDVKHPRSVFRLALACLALFGVLGMVHLPSPVGEDIVDATRGALLGATIVFVYLALRVQRRRRPPR